MATIVLDPVTRIEGHLKIAVTLDSSNTVTSAQSTGNLYRDFENMLVNRVPRDAAFLTQRVCGVCPVSHAVASSKAVENAARVTPPLKGIFMRNLVQGANFIASHILHFYHLAAMDYIQGPGMNPWTPGYSADLRLSAAHTQMLIDNYATALTVRRRAQEMGAIIGGKLPHVANFVPGGVTNQLAAADISNFQSILNEVQAFITNVYMNDVALLASAYDDYYNIGKGYGNLISFGVFDTSTSGSPLFPSGVMTNGTISSFSVSNIKEDVRYSYYSSASGLNPGSGATTPNYGKSGAYSWLKAPRYNNAAYEAGPLARVWMRGDHRRGISVMDRHYARCLEASIIASNMQNWITQVNGSGGYTTTDPASGTGIGLTEAPRGALGHWVSISASKITKYQIITPTCWNASPMDDAGNPGPIEKAMIGTKIADPNQPIELLRIVHSFDPCTACAVHVLSPKGVEMAKFIVQPGV